MVSLGFMHKNTNMEKMSVEEDNLQLVSDCNWCFFIVDTC